MNKNKLLIALSSLLVLALALTGCVQSPAIAQTTTPEASLSTNTMNINPIRTLSVTGNGNVTMVPDIAYINIGVHSEAEDVSSALQQNNDLAKTIAESLTGKGIDAKDIQTANFNIYPKTNYDQTTGNSVTVGYSVDNTVYVTVRDLKELGNLLDTAIQAGANQIYGISFDLKDRTKALEEARDLAIKDAQEKAKRVASVSGVELGQIQIINVSDSSYVQPYDYGYGYGMAGGGMPLAKNIDSSVPVSAGQIVITLTANLTYSIK